MAIETYDIGFTVLVTVFVFICYKVIYLLVSWYRIWNIFKDAPGPRHFHWLYGNMHLFHNGGYLNKCCRKYKRYFRIWFSPFKPVLILIHPDTVRLILKSSEPKNMGIESGYRFALPWLGEGLLIANGQKWARSRRLLTPAFHFDIIKPYVHVYNECTDIMLNNINKHADICSSFELFQVISSCTLDIILRCACSYKTDCQKEGCTHRYVEAVNEISKLAIDRSRQLWMYPDIIYNRTKEGQLFHQRCDYVHKVAEEVIENRKKELAENQYTPKKYKDFLDILLTAKDENGVGLSDLEIRNEVDTFIFEGHDTTASAVSWTLFCLACNTQYQVEAQTEIDDILKNRESDDIKWEDLPRLRYLTQCIKEGMRRFAPVPGIERKTTKEMKIDGKTYPPDTSVAISLNLLHNNPVVWEDPHVYDPERFSEENILKMGSFDFCPFSAGQRNCIGQNFAMNEEKVMIAKFLRRYKIRIDPSHTVHRQVAAVTRAANGIKVFIERRQHPKVVLKSSKQITESALWHDWYKNIDRHKII